MKRSDQRALLEEHAVIDDDKSPFFAVGRELESSKTTHHYTEQEKQLLNKHQAIDYFPPNSEVYRREIARQPHGQNTRRWAMMGLIGFAVGVMAFLVKNSIDSLADVRRTVARPLLEDGELFKTWLWMAGFSSGVVFLSAGIVVFLRPAAAGSGIPEVIAYLNGAHIGQIFNVKTLAVKFFSVIMAVGSGLPVGPEGPMIHMGAMVGAGVSQGRSRTLGLDLFSMFRDPRDKRNFISAGVAAGVSAAFGAPVGGLLFAMEEVSSFWNQALGWQTFFCSMVAVVTVNFLQSGFKDFEFHSKIGSFSGDTSVLFPVNMHIGANIISFIPTILVGLVGGILGTVFTFFNLKILRFRRRYINPSKFRRILEMVIVMILYATAVVYVPTAFGCREFMCDEKDVCSFVADVDGAGVQKDLEAFTCKASSAEGEKEVNVYNEAASLLFPTGDETVGSLFSRGTPNQFGYSSLLVMLAIYFPLACWSAGSAVSSGLVVPMLLIGGLFGRIFGVAMVDIFGYFPDGYWNWIDPGVFALIGAASFFGGVSRLTMSLTVIMIEITDDVFFLLPIMTAVMVSKWVADSCTHSLYHAIIEIKCLPFLDADASSALALDAVNVGHVMKSPVMCLPEIASVRDLAQLLLSTEHNSFPVVRPAKLPAGRRGFQPGVSGGRFAKLHHEAPDHGHGHGHGHGHSEEKAAEDKAKETAAAATGAGAAHGALHEEEAGDGLAPCPGLDNDLSESNFVGTVSRDGLLALLEQTSLFHKASELKPPTVQRGTVDPEMRVVLAPRQGPEASLNYDDVRSKYSRRDDQATRERTAEALNEILERDDCADAVIDLRPVVDESAFVVPFSFSLERAFIVFRSMGLRHLVVADECNSVAGIVTRFDLMGFHMEERIAGATAVHWRENPAQEGIELHSSRARSSV